MTANGSTSSALANTNEEFDDVPGAAKRRVSPAPCCTPFISSGELPSIKIGKRRLVRVASLNAWLASKEQRAA